MRTRPGAAAAYGAVFGIAFVLRLLVPLTGGGLRGIFGYDSSVYYAAGAALVHGRVPYRDFTLLHPPGVMLITAPAAWIGRLTSDQTGFAVATILFCAIGGANAVMVAALARRLRFGWGASLAGGLFYAAWFASIHAEYQSRLEPFGNLLLLGGLHGYAGITGRNPNRSVILCGAALGGAACVKLWYAVPLGVIIGWLAWADHRRSEARRAALAAVVAVAVVCVPFFGFAPSAMWDMVLARQLGRDPSNPLRHMLYPIVGAVVVVALLVLLARRLPAARLPVVLVLAQAVVLFSAPSFFVFYLDYLTPALALCVAAGATWRPSDERRWIGSAAAVGSAAVLVAVLVVPAIGLWYGRGGNRVGRFPAAPLAAAVKDSPCVMSDSPMGLIALDALSRNLANGCPNWIDVTGRTYGESTPRAVNERWQQALREYLLSGDAVIIRHAKESEMSPVTWDAIRSGGVLVAVDGEVVYRVRR